MAYRVGWTESAWQELEAAAQYIVQDSSYFASALIHDARLAAQVVAEIPKTGPYCSGTERYFSSPSLRQAVSMIYEVGSDRVIILSFLHGVRQFPETI